MNGYQCKAIAEQNPKYNDCNQYHGKQTNLVGRYRKNIADKVLIVFCEAGAAERSNEYAQSNGGAGKDTNQCIGGMIAAASYKRKE